jgi:hypothetical protein
MIWKISKSVVGLTARRGRGTDRPGGPLRLALVGTPRSGNTWLRRILAAGYVLEGDRGRQLAVHDPAAADWENEESGYIVQVHLARESVYERLFASHAVRVVVPSRHPFDVLISVLNYATKVHNTELWLNAKGGDESLIRGLHPCHPRFLEYARGPRAAALLAVSAAWSQAPGAIRLRYEDLVASPISTLNRVASEIGEKPEAKWETVCGNHTMELLRLKDGRDHHWQGRPGLWKSLLTREAAEAIAEAHRPLLRHYGGLSGVDNSLTFGLALDNWRRLAAPARAAG